MKAKLTVEMDNAAFENDAGHELAGILRDLADHCDGLGQLAPGNHWRAMDTNGNAVGELKVTR